MIKGLLVKPYELPKEIEIEDTLENLQGLVEGNIECVYLQNDSDVVLVCNDEGKINNMPLNRDMAPYGRKHLCKEEHHFAFLLQHQDTCLHLPIH